MPDEPRRNFFDRCRQKLLQDWAGVDGLTEAAGVPDDVRLALRACVNSRTKTYRYVLPTQILGKLVDRTLDCRATQEGSDLPGAFDARSLCARVIVPFDRDNHRVLGGAADPYVNNPLRVPSVTPKHRSAQRDKAGFDQLCLVLEFVEQHPDRCQAVFGEVLIAIHHRLQSVRITYPVPNRSSHQHARGVIQAFLAHRSGGVGLQCVSVALFKAVGQRLKLYDTVSSSPVNAADASTGRAADLTCSCDDEIVWAVEVKDRRLALVDVQDKLPSIRELAIRELLFVVQGGTDESDAAQIDALIEREFASGQNIYNVDFDSFLDFALVLLGEAGRRGFLASVGEALEEYNADLEHRQRWAGLLGGI